MSQKYVSLDNKIFEIIKDRAQLNQDQDMVLITPALLQNYLEKKYGLNPSMPTLRKNGFGYGRKYSTDYDSTEYRHQGDPNKRGLVVKPEQFLEEVES